MMSRVATALSKLSMSQPCGNGGWFQTGSTSSGCSAWNSAHIRAMAWRSMSVCTNCVVSHAGMWASAWPRKVRASGPITCMSIGMMARSSVSNQAAHTSAVSTNAGGTASTTS